MPARLSLLLALFFLPTLASAATLQYIPIPNGSFEAPTLPMVSPYASPNISDWQKSPMPTWAAEAGYTADDWADSAGTFVNVPYAPIDNLDGNQLAFMFSAPGYALYQDLSATFKVGNSYTLTVGIQGGGAGMVIGCPMDIELYYRDVNGDQVPVGATEATNTNSTGVLSHLTDYALTIPAVAANDPWAGQNIGVELLQTATDNAGGYWDIDNVRLTTVAVPEPSSLALLIVGVCLLAMRTWRVSKK